MTDLTQDWKDGKLPDGWYYVKYEESDKIFISECFGGDFPSFYPTDVVQGILDEVPDYNLWQNLWNIADMEHKANNKLLEDVERLEQMLESQKQTNLALIKRLEEKVTNVKEALDFLQAESSELSI